MRIPFEPVDTGALRGRNAQAPAPAPPLRNRFQLQFGALSSACTLAVANGVAELHQRRACRRTFESYPTSGASYVSILSAGGRVRRTQLPYQAYGISAVYI